MKQSPLHAQLLAQRHSRRHSRRWPYRQRTRRTRTRTNRFPPLPRLLIILLQVLSDGVYLELISFTHPASHYPINSPERRKRDHHRWASKSPGWIDYAFLGNGSTDHERSISNVINRRAAKEGTAGDVIYVPEVPGGRKRPDGVELKWLISSSQRDEQIGVLPFFCGDVTPRDLRVSAIALLHSKQV